jgi:hypothetical protein
LGAACERPHGGAERVEAVSRTAIGWSFRWTETGVVPTQQKRSTIMPKENELTNQRELTEQELEFVAGGFPDVMEWFFGPYFSLLNNGSNCPAYVCGTMH